MTTHSDVMQDRWIKRQSNGKRVLITGVNGFVGSHLSEAYLADGAEVIGTIRSHRSPMTHLREVLKGPNRSRLTLVPCDLTDSNCVRELACKQYPRIIHHLAAQSYVPESWKNPAATMEANVIGTLNILEAARTLFNVSVQFASSSEVYGDVRDGEAPIKETNPLRPLSPYGVSKAAADMLCRQYAASYKIDVVVTRAFNHSGPRRGHVFAESDWALQIARAEKAKKPCIIKHGNLNAVRDYVDVRDVVRGYRLAALHANGIAGGVYNLARGKGYEMGDILKFLSARSKVRVKLVKDHTRVRPSDVNLLVGSAARAEEDLNWSPRFTVDEMLGSLLDYWRAKVRRD